MPYNDIEAIKDILANGSGSGSGGGKSIIYIPIDTTEYTVNVSWNEVVSALNDGKLVIFTFESFGGKGLYYITAYGHEENYYVQTYTSNGETDSFVANDADTPLVWN